MESVPPTKCQKQMRNPPSATTTFNPLTGSQLNGDPWSFNNLTDSYERIIRLPFSDNSDLLSLGISYSL